MDEQHIQGESTTRSDDRADGIEITGDIGDVTDRLCQLLGDKTVTAVAQSININKETVRRYLHNGDTPSAVFIRRVCDRYGVSAEWLLCGRGEPPSPEPGEE